MFHKMFLLEIWQFEISIHNLNILQDISTHIFIEENKNWKGGILEYYKKGLKKVIIIKGFKARIMKY